MKNTFKVTVEKKIVEDENNSYPCYKIGSSGTIVLFNKPCGGTIIQTGDGWKGALGVGDYIDNWGEHSFTVIHDVLKIEML